MKNILLGVLRLLGWIWSLPCSILGYLAVVLLIIFNQQEWIFRYDTWYLVFDFRMEGWFFRTFYKKRLFFACVIGTVIFIGDSQPDHYHRVLKHEKRHAWQYMVLGILFLVVWLLETLRVYLFLPGKHSYYDNFLERDARRYAGQLVDIPKKMWPQGPEDRWLLW